MIERETTTYIIEDNGCFFPHVIKKKPQNPGIDKIVGNEDNIVERDSFRPLFSIKFGQDHNFFHISGKNIEIKLH
jgi:hypothetical protein